MAAKKKTGSSAPKQRMPKTIRPSEEMQRWSVLLEQEITSWPKVSMKRMFGMKTFYRGSNIFAGVPDKCGFFSPNGVIFKINSATPTQVARMKADKRVDLDFGRVQKWFNFVLDSDRDLNGALEWFAGAYESAGKQPIKKTNNTKRKK
jgi:hypothetical protein